MSQTSKIRFGKKQSHTRSLGVFVYALLLILGCGPKGDTGYVGVWERGNDRVTSTLEIYQYEDKSWDVRWLRKSNNDRTEVTCYWGKPCEEWVDGSLAGTHTFEAWMDEASGRLMVKKTSVITEPRELKTVTIDELALSEDGLTLWSFTNERDGQVFANTSRPKRLLTKKSDQVSEIPSK